MLSQIKEQFYGKYSKVCVSELESMEDTLLHYKRFRASEAFELGNEIVKQSRKYTEDMIVRIVRQSDSITVFQYVGNQCNQRNLDFAQAKYRTVLKTNHCSLWALAKEASGESVDEVFSEDSGYLPAGGAFPIYEGDNLVAIVTTSGLHDGNDYRVVVDALCELQGKENPEFSGLIV